MKLVHPLLEGHVVIEDGGIFQLVIESPELYAEYLRELFSQIQGDEGRFVLSEGEEEYELSKYAEIIFNPFAVNVNDKRILSKLYNELERLANDTLYMETIEIISKIHRYIQLLDDQTVFALQNVENLNIIDLLKAFGVRIVDDSETFLEKIDQYIRVQAELLKRKLLIFVNPMSYMTQEQKREMELTAKYHKIGILFIDNMQNDFTGNTLYYIIDRDKCEIFAEK